MELLNEALEKAFEMVKLEDFLSSKFDEIYSELKKHEDILLKLDAGIIISFNVANENKSLMTVGTKKGIDGALKTTIKYYKENVK